MFARFVRPTHETTHAAWPIPAIAPPASSVSTGRPGPPRRDASRGRRRGRTGRTARRPGPGHLVRPRTRLHLRELRSHPHPGRDGSLGDSAGVWVEWPGQKDPIPPLPHQPDVPAPQPADGDPQDLPRFRRPLHDHVHVERRHDQSTRCPSTSTAMDRPGTIPNTTGSSGSGGGSWRTSAPFDVDVTTQDPGTAGLTYSGTGDTTWGPVHYQPDPELVSRGRRGRLRRHLPVAVVE